MDSNRTAEFKNEFFSITKGPYTRSEEGAMSRSIPRYETKVFVRKGDIRYWIEDNSGNILGGFYGKEFGCKTVKVLRPDIIAAEITDNCWRFITTDGRCIPDAECYDESILEIGDFENGFSEVKWINGLFTYVNSDFQYFIKTPQNDFVPIPEGYLAGAFLSDKVSVLMNKDTRLFFCDEKIMPFRLPNNEPIAASSYEMTAVSWAIQLNSRSNYENVRVLNLETGKLSSFQWWHIVSCSSEKLGEDCLQIKAHKKERDEESNSWNIRYIESDYYAAIFRNGEHLEGTDDFEILQDQNLLLTHQDKNNGCYSLNGKRVLRPLYDAVSYNPVDQLFSIELDGRRMTADTEGRLLFGDITSRVALPNTIVSYEKIKDGLLIVAQYHDSPHSILHGALEYGLFNTEQMAYQIPCKFQSFQYVTDDIIIVSTGYSDHMGIVDLKGNVVVPLKYHQINVNYDNTISFQEKSYSYERDKFSTGFDLKRSLENGDDHVLVPVYYEPKPFRHFGEPHLCFAKYYYGLCVVQRNGRYGVIDGLLDEIIPCEYDDVYCIDADDKALLFAALSGASITIIETFSGRRLSTKAKEIHNCFKDSNDRRHFVIGETTTEDSYNTTRYGLMDYKGSIVFDTNYYSIRHICGDLVEIAEYGESKTALARVDGTVLSDFVFYHANLRQNMAVVCETSYNSYYDDSDSAIYSKSGECIAPIEARAKDFEAITDDIIKVRFADDNYGFVFQLFSTSGAKLTAERYSFIGAFRNNEALVNLGGRSFFAREDENGRHYGVKGGKYGVISADYSVLIEPKYSLVRKNVDGLRVVSEEKDGEHFYGVVSFDGSSIIDCKYKYLGDPYEHQILFAEGGEWHSQGEKRDALFTADRRQRWLVNARWGIINTQDVILVPASYEYIYRPLDKVSIVVHDHKYGFYNYEDQLFFIPRYDFLEAFSEGLCVVGKKDETSGRMLYGYINKQNKEVIPCKYLKAFHFKDGEAKVETENSYCVIDTNDQIKYSQDKAELARWRAEEEEARARAEEEEYDRRQMIEDGLREASNGEMSNRWND